MFKKQIPSEAVVALQRRLAGLPSRSPGRRQTVDETAELYGVSEQSLYRALARGARPKALRRSDHGVPRVLPAEKMEYFCELIAAMKVRTSNRKGRHLSTPEAIRLIEEFGVHTPAGGLIKAPAALLKSSTVNRYLRQWGCDKNTWTPQPVAVRFEAEQRSVLAIRYDCHGKWSAYFATRTWASRPGPAMPRAIGRLGASACTITSHLVQHIFGRTCRITLKLAGTHSSTSETSSLSLFSSAPQAGQPCAAGMCVFTSCRR